MIRLLPHNNQPLGEVRPAYFLEGFDKQVENMRIVSFGACNFQCPYCKRDGHFRDKKGNIITSKDFSLQVVYSKIKDAINKGERIRLSGGDPCVFPQISLEIAKFVYMNYGKKVSIAHNGSKPNWVKKMLPYLEYAAIDLKAGNITDFMLRSGINNPSKAKKFFNNSLKTQEILSTNGVLVDVRTCVFKETTLNDLKEMAKLIIKSGNVQNKFWTIRQYKPVKGNDWIPMSDHELQRKVKIINELYPQLKMGIRAKWKPSGFHFVA